MKMANQGSVVLRENITGLKFGDLYRQRTQKIKIFKIILNLAPYFMILKTITNSDRRESRINNRQRTNCYLLAHGTAGI
jgi:predicted RNA-binding protein